MREKQVPVDVVEMKGKEKIMLLFLLSDCLLPILLVLISLPILQRASLLLLGNQMAASLLCYMVNLPESVYLSTM